MTARYRDLAARVRDAEARLQAAGVALVHARNRARGSTVIAAIDPCSVATKLLKKRGHSVAYLCNLAPRQPERCQSGWSLSLTPHCLRSVTRPVSGGGATTMTALDIFVEDLLAVRAELAAAPPPSRFVAALDQNSLAAVVARGGEIEPYLFSLLAHPGVGRTLAETVMRRVFTTYLDSGEIHSRKRKAPLATLVCLLVAFAALVAPLLVLLAAVVVVRAIWKCAILAVLGLAFFAWSAVQINRHVETAQRLKQDRKEAIDEQIENARISVLGIRGQFCVVSAAKYLEFGRLKSHEELRDMGDLLFFDTIKEVSIFLSQAENFCVFFSHQWLGWSVPDPENVQYKTSVLALQAIASKEKKDHSKIFVWYDYASIPQRAPELQKLAIISLPTFASIVDSFVVIAPDAKHADSGQACGRASYLKRAWCRAEVMSHWTRKGTSTMYWATDSGLEMMAPEGAAEDFLIAADVFGGDLTCCRLGHRGGTRCDREDLMLPMLGLYQEIMSKKDEPIFAAIEPKVGVLYPQFFQYIDENGIKTTRPLFGDLIKAAKEKTAGPKGSAGAAPKVAPAPEPFVHG